MRTQSAKVNGLPEAKVCRFKLNETTGWYQMESCPPGFVKVPPELRIEETIRPDKINSNLIIRSRVEGGRYKFFTGMLPAGRPGLFFGDYFEFQGGAKVNSFCLFYLTDANRRLEVHFFNRFKVYPSRRQTVIVQYWK